MKEFLTKPFLYLKNKQFLSLYSLKYLSQLTPDYFNSKNTGAYMLHFYIKGKGTYKIDYHIIEVGAGAALFSPLSDSIPFHTSKECEGFGLIFSEAFFGRSRMKNFFLQHTLLFNSVDKFVFFPIENRAEELMMLFQLVIDQLRREHSEVQEQILLNYIFSILLISEEVFTKERQTLRVANEIKLIKNFKFLFNRESNRRQSVQFFCTKMNISLSTLDRAFRKYEKSSAKKWINTTLIKEIDIELKRFDMSIGEIAFKFGFSEVTNFTKFYKGQTGITPKQFRSG